MDWPPVKVVRRGRYWRLQEPDGSLLPKKYTTKAEAEAAMRGRNAGIARSRRRR